MRAAPVPLRRDPAYRDIMRRPARVLVLGCLSLLALGGGARAATQGADQAADQGASWTDAARADYYSRDQGSRLIPLRWLRALKAADGSPFAAKLTRYGYVANPFATGDDALPIGFTQAPTPRGPAVGMTCAACHERELVANGTTWRIDGAPANADFGAFVTDLDAAVARVLASDAAFAPFAQAVLGDEAQDLVARETLKVEVRYWSTRFHALVAGTLKTAPPSGPTRLDAFAFIFNAVGGLSIGPRPIYLMPGNIHVGAAPVRYPVLWDSGKQDRTQWTGIAANGTKEMALARGVTELLGVFGHFRPVRTPGALGALDRDYLLHNTTNFAALAALDETIASIGPPAWPFGVDQALADKGKAVFARPTADGGCAACHGEQKGAVEGTWKTPLVDVGTDRAAWHTLMDTVDTGDMAGASIPGHVPALKPTDTSLNLLRVSVGGTLIGLRAQAAVKQPVTSLVLGAVAGLLPKPMIQPEMLVPNGYEARVLRGIWAAAPYLHDGAVPTLADLLEPADRRPKSFAIGAQFDTARVGLAATQPPGTFVLQTTGCDDLASSRSVCGHEYGTHLPPEDKKALLEYLKTL
jgi:cytochrome c553